MKVMSSNTNSTFNFALNLPNEVITQFFVKLRADGFEPEEVFEEFIKRYLANDQAAIDILIDLSKTKKFGTFDELIVPILKQKKLDFHLRKELKMKGRFHEQI